MSHGHNNPGRASRELARDIARDRAAAAGSKAAVDGVPYDDNPYDRMKQPQEFLEWSQAHNGMRAKIALDRDKGPGFAQTGEITPLAD